MTALVQFSSLYMLMEDGWDAARNFVGQHSREQFPFKFAIAGRSRTAQLNS